MKLSFFTICLLLNVLFIIPARLEAATFADANTLYEQRKFSEAAAAYQDLIESGTVTANVFFNLGNAHFKSGEFGQAIAAYRRAQFLDPRDPDIRANLRFARDKVQNSGASTPVESWLNRLKANEWLLLACVLFWICFLLLAFAQLRPDWRKVVRGYAMAMGILAVFFGVLAGLAHKSMDKAAVVISPETVVRHGPFNESQSAFSLREGAELVVLDQRENWIQVSAGDNRVGWVPSAQVTVIN